MKKLFNLLMVALMAVCFAVPAMGKAEAAKVVVLPLVNNSGSETAGPDLHQRCYSAVRLS